MSTPTNTVRTLPISRLRLAGVWLAIVAAAAIVFVVDMRLPRGAAGGVPYVGAVLISLLVENRRATVYTAVGCTMLVVLAAILNPEATGTSLELELLNRAYALLAIWITATAVSNRVETESQLRTLASRDSLTGVHNRRQLVTLLDQAFTSAQRYRQPLSVCVCDLDGFKLVNDRFGHPAGDRVLVRFAELLVRELRDADIVGRMGGDEFCIVMPQTTVEEAAGALERVRRAVSETDWTPGETPEKSISGTFGLAAVRPHMADADDLVKAADAALYRGKEGGRDRVVVAD